VRAAEVVLVPVGGFGRSGRPAEDQHVERAELDVLSGIDADDWTRIAQIVVEVHDEAGRGAVVARMLEERGFIVSDEQQPTMRGTDIRLLYAVHHAAG
jgi:hypothetical protein